MLFYDFKNYEEFKELFGIIEHGNGVKSRKNKILLALYKDRQALKQHIAHKYYESCHSLTGSYADKLGRCESHKEFTHSSKYRAIRDYYYDERRKLSENGYRYSFLVSDMTTLKQKLYRCLAYSYFAKDKACFELNLMDRTFYSDSFATDDMNGLCEDGTINAIRYRNIEKGRIFKMKAGKLFNNIMSCNKIIDGMPEQIKRWFSEEFVADWILYAQENIGNTEYKLHVDDNFGDIYDSDRCKGYDTNNDSFGSCMVNDGQWTFYRDAVKAKAAYLTDSDDMIVARCIVFTDVTDEDGNKWRLAERQYAYQCDDALKRMLVSALIREGHIDGYKRVGSSCHDGRAFVTNDGESLSDKGFCISCCLDFGDTLSYQDSFKYYDYETGIADNYGNGNIALDVTSSSLESEEENHEDDNWSDYHQEYISDYESTYVDTRDDYFYNDEVVYASVYHTYSGRYCDEYCYEGDCLRIGNEYYYAGADAESPGDYNIYECPQCGDYFVCGEDSCYSELTEEDYCCNDCMEEAERRYHEDRGDVYSEYDGQWFEYSDDVIYAQEYYCGRFHDTTISIESFNELVETGKATEYDGEYYIDDVLMDGEPAHLLTLQKCVA